jgi:hypothetical protein
MTDYEIDFAVFCDGPLSAKLRKDKDPLYKSYIDKTREYGHCEDYMCLEKWLNEGLNATTAIKHILEVYRKNYETFYENIDNFQTFTSIIMNYDPDIDSVIHELLTFDDIDDYYPSYLNEYGEEIKIRAEMLDSIIHMYFLKNGSRNEIREYFVTKCYEYHDWSTVKCIDKATEKCLQINSHNCTDVYLVLLKSNSSFLQSI